VTGRGRALFAATVLSLCAAPATAAAAPPPPLSAPSAILVQPQTGDVVYARAADRRRQIASTTKLMTALLALERRTLSSRMTAVGYSGAPAESVVGLTAGERLTTADLLRALLLASANDAAATIAVNVGGSTRNFVRLMNQRARRAGLTHTHYANPVGLDDPRNVSTARDLAKLALLVRRNAFATAVMDRRTAVLRSGSHVRVVANRNTLVGAVPWVNGVKTGHTSTAGFCLVGSARRGGVQLISVVLGTPSEAARNADTLALMRWGFGRYARVTPVRAGATITRLPVRDQDRHVAIVPARTVRVVVRDGERPVLRRTGLPTDVEGPVARGTRVGELVVSRRGRVVDRVPLVTGAAIAQATLWQRTRDLHGPLILVLLVALAVAGAASLTAGRRRSRRRGGHARSETA
jgi:serine-type D-Ala-D-Ala carboxypeptidase (penicillin-binding protein 5/6)